MAEKKGQKQEQAAEVQETKVAEVPEEVDEESSVSDESGELSSVDADHSLDDVLNAGDVSEEMPGTPVATENGEFHVSGSSLEDALSEKSDPIDHPERQMSFTDAFLAVATVKQHPGRLVLALVGTLIVITLLIMLVSFRHQILELGYNISQATVDREALLENQRKLKIELRVLSRRERLEPIARRNLGMVPVKPEQILYVPSQNPKAKVEPRRLEMPVEEQPEPKTGREDGLDRIEKIME